MELTEVEHDKILALMRGVLPRGRTVFDSELFAEETTDKILEIIREGK